MKHVELLDVYRTPFSGKRRIVSCMMWRYGFRVWFGRYSIALLGPRDPRMFSERNGYRRPVLRVGPWRVFVDKPNTELLNPARNPKEATCHRAST